MRTLVHLSDLHFGRVEAELPQPLLERVRALDPDVVVVSGDLTQRARAAEFEQARRFLDQLPGPQIVVPGNHDVPLYNVVARLLRPLAKFKRYIGRDLQPVYRDDELAVVGVNTARALVLKNGRIDGAQMRGVRQALCELPASVVKVVVTHHPFDLPPGAHHEDVVGRAGQAMAVFAQCGVDVLLAGHLHEGASHDTGLRWPLAGYEALMVSAGTATSTRSRGQPNGFNVLRLAPGRAEVERFEWVAEKAGFLAAGVARYERAERGWRQLA